VEADEEATVTKAIVEILSRGSIKQRHIKRYPSTSSSNHLSDFQKKYGKGGLKIDN